MGRIIAAVVASTLLAAACSSGGSNRASPTPSPAASPTLGPSPTASERDPTEGSKVVRFRTSDGVSITGRDFGSGDTVVVLAHQIDDDQSDWFDFAAGLTGRGYRALTFNYRGVCSSSPEEACSSGAVDPNAAGDDVAAAVAFVRGANPDAVFLIGASLGGEAVIVAAAKPDVVVDGVVTLSASEGLVGLVDRSVSRRRVATIDAPALFIAGAGDGSFADNARDYEAHARPPKDLLILQLGDHGVALLHSAEGERVTGSILAFLAEHSPG